ncbi:class II aldolase/adducin family protein [Mammaliicoccus sciuri]|uniref:class II aldolase/adducin family protein n=1 Tax=Mammaliicoccus sciuri TaxID=1296 RepID=UPI000E69C928|nr:class II aldolase/adducin family protein [Mammaliicoccus sciuri]RIO17956.1 class II aldolase/adducin family protein [Mammaliicoccus sciuri]
MKISQSLHLELEFLGKEIIKQKLAAGPGGNISVIDEDVIWISPSGFNLDEVKISDWVPIDKNTGNILNDHLRPSSEIEMHRLMYLKDNSIKFIVHTHPIFTLAILSSGYKQIPFLFPDHVAIAGNMPLVKYVKPCSVELANEVVKNQIVGGSGLLLENHGLITVGSTSKEALTRTSIVEAAAEVFVHAKSIGTPKILTEQEIADILNLDAEKYRQELLKRGD